MNIFGLTVDQIDLIKKKIQDIFGVDTDLKVYIFGSRATEKNKKNSDIDLAFKSKDPELNKKISKLRSELEDSKIPYKCDLVNWFEIIDDYLPAIKKNKKIFWTKNDVLITSPWRICPLGYHWVSEHLKEGNIDTTNPHCRRNPSHKDVLKAEEILKITELEIFQNPPIRASTNDMGYKGLDKKFDNLINGWCAYWNSVLGSTDPLHPNILKALIATESGFEVNPKRTAKHTAIGITQIMPQTIKLLSIRSNELKSHFVEITKEEAFNPVVNICASTRWLFRKYELMKKRKKSITWLNVLEEYKGIGKQKGKESDEIRNRIMREYKKLDPKVD